jgi:hypothetical protein
MYQVAISLIEDYTEVLKVASDYSMTICVLSSPPKRELNS